MLIVVILDIFQCFQVVLNVWVFVVVNEIFVCQWWIWCFEIDFVVWVDFFFYVEVEVVGVVIFIGYVWYYVEFGGIQMVEVVIEVFIWCVVQVKVVVGFVFLLIYGLVQMFYNCDVFSVKLFVVVQVFVVEQCVNGFMDINVVQRDGCMIIFKDFRYVVVCFQLYVVGVFYIQDRCDVGFYVFKVGDMGYQCFLCQCQMFIQQFLECGFVVFCFQCDVWQVKVNYVQVVMFVVDLFVVFVFLYVEEVVVVYWCFE